MRNDEESLLKSLTVPDHVLKRATSAARTLSEAEDAIATYIRTRHREQLQALLAATVSLAAKLEVSRWLGLTEVPFEGS